MEATLTIRRVLICVPAILIATYPLATVIAANAGLRPLDPWVIARSYLAIAIATAVVLGLARSVQRDLATRAIWLGWALLCFGLYGFVVLGVQFLGVPVSADSGAVAVVYVGSTLAALTIRFRPWGVRRLDPRPLSAVAGVIVVMNLSLALSGVLTGRHGPWREAADALIRSSVATGAVHPDAQARDIYYVILDGFGRADILEKYYGVDLTEHIAWLRSKGFYVAAEARSNYSQTFLSLASMLNMNYLDEVAATLGETQDRRPLQYLIDHNGLMRAARRSGYAVIGVGSDYMATLRIAQADVCFCDRPRIDDIEYAAMELTPLAALPLGAWRADAHRRKVVESFSAIEQAAAGQGRKFVFVHVIAPHPPFVFRPDGSPRPLTVASPSFLDGDHFRGPREEYRRGYREQVQFIARRLTMLVQFLLSRSRAAPVIIVHGDHGPGSRLHWEDPVATDTAERMAIFAAYLFPDGAPLYPSITPVNASRVLANRYFGADLPPLPDTSWFSTWRRPYRLLRVP